MNKRNATNKEAAAPPPPSALPKQQEALILMVIVKLLSVTASVLTFSWFAFLFNEVYIKESDLFRYTLNMLGFLVAGALLGMLIAPHMQYGIEQMHRHIIKLVRRYPSHVAASASVGMVVGMALAVLVSVPVHIFFPSQQMIGISLFSGAAVVFAYLGALVFSRLTVWGGEKANGGSPARLAPRGSASPKIIDSSAILDGRFYPLCKSGFLEGRLIVPTVVLVEIQKIADDSDPIRRQRGRTALETLEQLRDAGIPIEVEEVSRRPGDNTTTVDTLLVQHAVNTGASLVTNDYNLTKIAELRDVPTYNLNVLANTLRKTMLPGEIVEVNVVKYGKEVGQGIAYLDDGTMIVIESADKFIGEIVKVEIRSIMQTVAGRLIFASLCRENGQQPANGGPNGS